MLIRKDSYLIETLIFGDRDPIQLNKKFKDLLQKKKISKDYRDNKMKFLMTKKRMVNKLISTKKGLKVYRSSMKTFINNKKISSTPPLSHNNEQITGFKEKAELFNLFFIKQYSLLKNENDLPAGLNYLTKKRLFNINFPSAEIAKILANLNPNKAHRLDKITIFML